jgi:hypothetical protein
MAKTLFFATATTRLSQLSSAAPHAITHQETCLLGSGVEDTLRIKDRAIKSCVECERYETGVESIEVWTLFAVRYTCLILVYFIAFN